MTKVCALKSRLGRCHLKAVNHNELKKGGSPEMGRDTLHDAKLIGVTVSKKTTN